MSATLEAVARELFDRESQRVDDRRARAPIADEVMQVCPVSWLLPELLQLIAERHDQPVERVRSAIGTLIRERAAMYACGRGLSQDEADDAIESQVDLIVRVLERVRRRALDQGDWSEMPAAPVMCG